VESRVLIVTRNIVLEELYVGTFGERGKVDVIPITPEILYSIEGS